MIQEHERKIYQLEIKVGYLEADQQRLKDELAVYQAAAVGANRKMDAVLSALVGDDSTKTKGLVHRLESIEVVADWAKQLKWKFVGGLIVAGWAAALLTWVLDKLFK